MPTFKTHNDLTIGWIPIKVNDETIQLVYIEGAVRKPLYQGSSVGEAKATYDNAVSHYEARQAAETPEAEAQVAFIPRQTPEAKAYRERERLKKRAS